MKNQKIIIVDYGMGNVGSIQNMLKYLGAKISTIQLPDSSWKITLEGLPILKPLDIEIPSDPSSAAFPVVASIITPNSEIKI